MNIRIIAVSLFLLLGLVFAPALSASPQLEKRIVNFGVLACLTGGCAEPGIGMVRGAEMAVADLNRESERTGISYALIVEDSQEGDGNTQLLASYAKLRSLNKVRYFIGPTWTPGGLAIAPIVAKDRDVLMVSPTLGARAFSAQSENIFNSRGTDEAATRASARYVWDQGIKRVAIFSSQQAWDQEQGNIFKQQFLDLGGSIVAHEEPLPNATDLRVEALRITAKSPEAVFFSCYAQLPLASKAIAQRKFTGPKFAALVDNLILTASEKTLEGTVFHSFPTVDSTFRSKLEQLYGPTGEFYAAVTYDSIRWLASVITQSLNDETGTFTKRFAAQRYNGVSGEIVFDTDRVAIRSVQRWRVEHGGIVATK